MIKSGDSINGDLHSVCSSVQSSRNGQAAKKTSRHQRPAATRRNRLNFNRFSLRSLFCNFPFGRRFRTGSSAVFTVNKNRQSSNCDGSSSSDNGAGINGNSYSVNVGGAGGGNVVPKLSNGHSSSLTSSYQPDKNASGQLDSNAMAKKVLECPLCLMEQPIESFPFISTCKHRSCFECLQQYLNIEISESRINISCPVCTEAFHPSDLQNLLENCSQSSILMMKYQDFMVRRVLLNTEPDARWCPAPDCNYAVIASGCASCPKLQCESPGCETFFCYHCKQEWHPNQTCDAARAERSPNMYNMYHHTNIARSSSVSFSQGSNVPQRDDIKPCPRCQVLIVKMDDGSCNHISCIICGSEFCWLCMKEISDLHYLSPSGCTFWGKKPWSRKKKILWQLGTLVGAPIGIGLMAGIAIPAMIIGIPVWVGIKIHTQYGKSNKRKRNIAIGGGVTASILIAPIVAGIAVSIGVPVLLAYVYGVVPVSLCRSGGCGVSTSPSGGVKIIDFADDDQSDPIGGLSVAGTISDGQNLDSVSVSQQSGSHTVNYQSISAGNPSIGEASLQGCSVSATISFDNDSQMERMATISVKEEQEDVYPEADRVSASTHALAGSIASSILVTSSGSANIPSKMDLHAQSDGSSNKRLSMSSASPSERSNTMSMTNDDNCSTKALAGSIVGYREATAYNAPVEVHVDAPVLDLTIDAEPATTCITISPSVRKSSTLLDQSSSSLVDTSTQTMNITDVSVNPVITSTSIMYPRSLSTDNANQTVPEDGKSCTSSEVGVQVEIDKFICDKTYTESTI